MATCPILLEKISPFGLEVVGEIVFPPYHGYRSKREMEPWVNWYLIALQGEIYYHTQNVT